MDRLRPGKTRDLRAPESSRQCDRTFSERWFYLLPASLSDLPEDAIEGTGFISLLRRSLSAETQSLTDDPVRLVVSDLM